MIADMAINGFSPSDVCRWSLGQWREVCSAYERAYDTEPDKPPAPTTDELLAFKASGPWVSRSKKKA